jgi:zinc protease
MTARATKAMASAVLLALLTVAAPEAARSATEGPEITNYTLDNGLELVVIQDHRAPVVAHMVWYRVGSADETPGKSGIAHFLEHLMFKGTETVGPGEFSQEISVNGGQDNAFTSTDFTAYHQRIAADRLGLVMRLEADRMANLMLAEEDVDPEREVVLEERASRTDSHPSGRMNEQIDAALYLAHPYGRPIIGWEHEIRGLTRQDAIDFYERNYTPANAFVIVAGDVVPAEVKALADTYYGTVVNRFDPTPRQRVVEPPPAAARRVILEDARVGSPRLSRKYLTVSQRNAAPGEAAGLQLLAEILGAGPASRLYRALVVDKAVAVDAGAYYQGDQLDYGEFGVYAVLGPDGDPAVAEAALDAAIAELARGGVTPDELARVKTQLVADTIYSRDSHYRLARDIGSTLATGGTVEEYLRWPADIEAATAGDIAAAARTYLVPERSVTGILRAPAAPAGERS